MTEAAPATASAAPAAIQLDETARYLGTVSFYNKLRGFGFIESAQKGVLPEDRVFVHWKNIQSGDRFPFLMEGLEVEFGVVRSKEWGRESFRAKAVALPGGGLLQLQNELDATNKTFVGGQDLRYTGTLKFYNAVRGFGYISVDAGYVVEGATIPTELRVEVSEVNAGGETPQAMQNLAVEFGIWTTAKGNQKAYNMTLPGGIPITQAALENRQALGGQTLRGEVHMWSMQQGWGFIKADPSAPLPPNVQAKLTQQAQAAAEKARSRGKEGSDEELVYVRKADLADGVRLHKGDQVKFQVYLDDKGVGACNVQTVNPE